MHKNMQVFTQFENENKSYPQPNTPMKGSRVDQFREITAQMKLRRRIEDYMRKYATNEQMNKIANFLGISH